MSSGEENGQLWRRICTAHQATFANQHWLIRLALTRYKEDLVCFAIVFDDKYEGGAQDAQVSTPKVLKNYNFFKKMLTCLELAT